MLADIVGYLVPQLVPVKFQDVDSITDAFQNVYFLAVSNVGIIYYTDNVGTSTTWNWQAVATLTLAGTGKHLHPAAQRFPGLY